MAVTGHVLHGVRLTLVLGHTDVDKVNNVGADGGNEDLRHLELSLGTIFGGLNCDKGAGASHI